jgi:DNA replication protein DnaC
MSTPQLERLREHCHQLRLYQVEHELTARLEQAAKKEISYADFLDELLALEVGSKAQKHHQMRIAMARFPFQKTLESFDFKFQPSIDPKQIRELATGRYMQSGDNLLLLGPPGGGEKSLSHSARHEGLRARRADALQQRDRADRHARQGPGRRPPGGTAEDPQPAAAANH